LTQAPADVNRLHGNSAQENGGALFINEHPSISFIPSPAIRIISLRQTGAGAGTQSGKQINRHPFPPRIVPCCPDEAGHFT